MNIFAQTRTSKVVGLGLITLLAVLTVGNSALAVNQATTQELTASTEVAARGTTAGAMIAALAETCPLDGAWDPRGFYNAYTSGQVSVSAITVNAATQKASVQVQNNTGCSAPLSLSSYRVFDGHLSHQKFIEGTGVVQVQSNSSRTFTVSLAPCFTQVDFWYGEHPRTLLDSNPYGNIDDPFVITWKFVNEGNFCTETQPQLVCSPNTQTVAINQNATVTATGGNGTYSWQATGGSPATGAGASFTTKYTSGGTKSVVVASGGMTATCAIVVTTPPPQLVCTPANQTVAINQNATMSATGGSGTYAWQAAGGTLTSGSGNNFSTKYSTSGNKTVTVTSAGQTASCAVNVTTPPPQLVCTPANQTVNVNQNASFSASGASGSYSWSANSGNPATGSGSTFNTYYTAAGSKVVQVTSAGQTATCNVQVNSTTQPQLVCSPANQTANLNQTVSVTATGGNGGYSWSAPEAGVATTSNNTLLVSYPTSGTKTITVQSGNQSAVCLVVVNQQIPTLTISKLVRNVTQGSSFAENLSNVRAGDVLEYQVRIRNSGNVDATNVQLRDFLNQANLLQDFRNLTASRSYTGQFYNGQLSFTGNLAANQEIVVGYVYTAATSLSNATTVCNTATAMAGNAAGVTDTACVTGNTGAPNLVLSKSAWNDTKNVNAMQVPANREDFITYTLTVRNTGNAEAVNFVVTDDLSGVLPLADITDFGGGTVTGQTISYPVLNIPANSTITKTFRVRVKFSLAPSISYRMVNTYGNTVTVIINPPPSYVPPRTGGMTGMFAGVGFAGLLTAAFALHRKKNLFKLIFT